jgi:uncharacterized protein (TIGR02466 family)
MQKSEINFEIHKVFPEILTIYKLPHDKKEEEFLKSLPVSEIIPSKSGENETKLCCISKNYFILEKNKILKNKLLKCVKHFSNEMSLGFDLKITTSWLTKTLPGGYSQKHFHALSFYSGVYYPFNSIKKYSLEFSKGHEDFFSITNYIKKFDHITNRIKVELDSNTLIIFNSLIKHRIPKNITNEDRYSLAFNMMPSGIVGNLRSDSNYNFK